MSNKPPGKRGEVYDAVLSLSARYGYAPTVREIAEFVGLKSPDSVAYHLNNLKETGWVDWQPGRSRTILVTRRPV